MKLYDSVGPNPRVVRMFMAEKGFDVPKVEIDVVVARSEGEESHKASIEPNPSATGTIRGCEIDHVR